MTLSLAQPSFAAGLLGAELSGRFDISKYAIGLRVANNVVVRVQGGVESRPGTRFVAETQDMAAAGRLVAFSFNTEQTYILEFGDAVMRVFRDGGIVLDGASPYELTTPWATADLPALQFAASADTLYVAHPGYAPRKITRTGHAAWSVATVAVDPANAAPTSATATPGGSGSETYVYKVASVDAAGRESFPTADVTAASAQDLSVAGAKVTISWTAAAGAVEYRLYKRSADTGAFGYIGYTTTTTFIDRNVAEDVEDTPVEASGLFGGANEYPAAVALHKERLGFAASNNHPETIWFSRTADYENFTRSRVTKATDRIEEFVTGQQVNRVRWMVPMQELVALTAGGEWSIRGASGVFAPGELAKDVISEYGASAALRPLVIGDALLWVEPSGRSIQEITFSPDAGYALAERTLLVRDLFRSAGAVAWCYARAPRDVVWLALSDGALLSMTYNRGQDVYAWCRHDVGGAVESLAAVREGDADITYMIVRRTIDGGTKRYVERLEWLDDDDPAEAFHLDCGLTYRGVAATTISGLDHLEGENVWALADGNVVKGLTVTGGEVTLQRAAALVHVGLPMIAEFETLPTAQQFRDGSARGRKQRVVSARMQVLRTRGIEVGPDADRLSPLPRLTGTPLGGPLPLETGMREIGMRAQWNDEGTVYARQSNPLPMRVLNLIPEIAFGD